MLIDTAGCGMEEAADEDSDSKRNEGEAKVIIAWSTQAGICGIAATPGAPCSASVMAGADAPVPGRVFQGRCFKEGAGIARIAGVLLQ